MDQESPLPFILLESWACSPRTAALLVELIGLLCWHVATFPNPLITKSLMQWAGNLQAHKSNQIF